MIKNEKILKWTVAATFLFLLLYFLTDKLVVGGRWSLGMFLGGVDNWLSGGSLYTNHNEGLSIGPLYGPGGAFIALIARLIFGYGAETAIILFGGVLAILLFLGFSSISKGTNTQRFWRVIICAFLFFIGFPYARPYLFEFHPDLPALLCWVWGVLFLNNFLTSRKCIWLICSMALYLLAGLFKANSVFLFIGLGFYVIIAKEISIKDKIIVLVGELVAGIGVLVVMQMLEGCIYNTVVVMGTHSFDTLATYCRYFAGAIVHNFIYIFLLVLTLFLLLKKRLKFNGFIEKMWAFSSVPWFLFGLLGAAKVGSNGGNIEASIIVFMPFVLPAIETMIDSTNGQEIFKYFTKSERRNIVYYSAYVCCIVTIFISTFLIIQNYNNYKKRINDQVVFAVWLDSHYHGNNIAFSAIEYELLNNTSLNKKTDLHMAGHYDLGHLIDVSELKKMSEREKWDVIITSPALGSERWPSLFDNFVKLRKEDYPNMIAGGSELEVYVNLNNN